MIRLQFVLWLGGMLLAGVVVRGEENPPWPTKAPALMELQDQFGKPQKLAFPNPKVTLLAIADKKGSAEVNAWIIALKPRYAGRIDIRGLADMGGVPGFLQGHVSRKFQASRKYPVMMDWSGRVCDRFGYRQDVANILVIDADGTIRERVCGAATDDGVIRISRALDAALQAKNNWRPAGEPKFMQLKFDWLIVLEDQVVFAGMLRGIARSAEESA